MTSPPSLSQQPQPRQRPSTVVWTETELWVQQFQTQRQLLRAARRVLDELKQATSTTMTSTLMMYPEAILAHPMELFEEDMMRRRHVQLICETRLVQLYRTLQRPISLPNNDNNNKDDLHSNENQNEDTTFPNGIIRTMQRNYPTPDMVRFAKDVRENERKLFHTISRDFTAAHQRSQAALHIMQGQGQGQGHGHGREGATGPISVPPNQNYQGYFHQFASSAAADPPNHPSSSSYHYQPYGTNSIIKQQYVRLHEMPFYAYGDALERVRKLQDDLEDEIVALELILLYGGGDGSGGSSSPTNNRQQQQQGEETEREEGEIEEIAVAATTDTSTDSPPYLTEPTSMEADHRSAILQQLTPHRSLLPTASPASTSSTTTLSNQNRNLAAERSPLRKAVGIISFPNDEDDDDVDQKYPPIMDTTTTTTTTSSRTLYPTQDLKSMPVSTPPKISETENTAETTPAAAAAAAANDDDDDTTSTPKGKSSSTDGGEWKMVVVMGGKKGRSHQHDLTLSSSTLEPLEEALKEKQHQQPQNKKKQEQDPGPWDASTSSSESA
ncbi:hypothetical protein IV203_007734 [Nitzschia inconspicua]|uniref:Uncharacterized protein n=1 Tax=Nitzschia inconspicua TaxID=303405 RepID=A0A9K3PM07_9STRA|nr:hypothetical protein IV203_007734 [Nitzschia inconspicua]